MFHQFPLQEERVHQVVQVTVTQNVTQSAVVLLSPLVHQLSHLVSLPAHKFQDVECNANLAVPKVVVNKTLLLL